MSFVSFNKPLRVFSAPATPAKSPRFQGLPQFGTQKFLPDEFLELNFSGKPQAVNTPGARFNRQA